jgi:hypothetical protein
MLDQTPKLPTAALQIPTQYDRKQRFKMIAALVLLLSALLVIVIKDAPNWFGSADDASADVDSSDSSGSQHPDPSKTRYPSSGCGLGVQCSATSRGRESHRAAAAGSRSCGWGLSQGREARQQRGEGRVAGLRAVHNPFREHARSFH